MSTDLIVKEVNFNGVNLIGIQKDGKVFVAIKKICDDLGVDFSSQHKRIKRDEILSEGVVIMTIPSKGGIQETFCLELECLPIFLTGISSNKCKSEIQPYLKEFKKKAKDILAEAFLGKKESTFEIPKSLGDALLLAGNLAKKNEKLETQIVERDEKIISLTPLAEFAKSQFNMIQKVPLSAFGKYLSAKIPGMGKNSISSFLVDQKLLFRNKKTEKIEVVAKYLRVDSNCQYFELKPSTYKKPILQNNVKIGEETATSWTKLILRSGMEKIIELCYQAGLINNQQFYLIQNDLPEWVKNAECETV